MREINWLAFKTHVKEKGDKPDWIDLRRMNVEVGNPLPQTTLEGEAVVD